MFAMIANNEAACFPMPSDTGPAPLPRIWDELAACDWRPSALARRLPGLVRQAGTLAPRDRMDWLSRLHDVWNRYGWALGLSARAALLELAAAWSAWPLAVAVGESLHREHRLDGAGTKYLIDACTSLGDTDFAIHIAVSMQLAYPAQRVYAQIHRDLIAWRDWRDAPAQLAGAALEDKNLILEPLGHHHVASFAWQYDDPAIAELCCLPRFEDDASWHRWLESIYACGDQRIFAVMHREWGCIGCVSLILHCRIGFFFYWIGPDFQGAGFGPRAASLMLEGARQFFDMRCCYAKVYDFNSPSLKALARIGFDDLGICGAPPDNDQVFYRLGEPQSRERTVHDLHDLMDYMGSDIRIAMPLMSP
ncbi:GNAT family N-acetyltransferase [Massilia sp. CCM 9210]|uniref:GNAT family N-acetyltransferase n=1 Tax=Massilia scottii TaxID=3057166 RepID=UPI002796BE4C|nr:GNAT family N-acetyltransferase [Massilia sp. CCM 9210]MDQ1812079.1 GNAT family N-acetyltransferase [Massilia sp. CCM 9210]